MQLIDAAETLENSLEEEKRLLAAVCLFDDNEIVDRHEALSREEIPANRKALREAIAAEKARKPALPLTETELTAIAQEGGFTLMGVTGPEDFIKLRTAFGRAIEKTIVARLLNPFESVADFEKRGLNKVAVKILYKKRIHSAWYHEGRFYFNTGTSECYLTECITGVRMSKRFYPDGMVELR